MRRPIESRSELPEHYLKAIREFVGDLNFVGGWIDDFMTSVSVWEFLGDYKVIRVFVISGNIAPAISIDLTRGTATDVIRHLLARY